MRGRARLRTLLILVAVAAVLTFVARDVSVQAYPSSIVSTADGGFDLFWRGWLFVSAARYSDWYRLGPEGREYRVTAGSLKRNVEITIRLGCGD